MPPKNQVISNVFERWIRELRELTRGVVHDPFAQGPGRRWEKDFPGEISKADIHYCFFIVAISMIPASIAAYVSPEVKIKMLAQLFGAPLRAVIAGFLASSLIFLGAHLNKVPRKFSVAFKVMLRLMSIHPILEFLWIYPPLGALSILLFGFFLIRAVRKTYVIPLRNALLFWGVVYFVFALMQLQATIGPAPRAPDYLYPPRLRHQTARPSPSQGR